MYTKTTRALAIAACALILCAALYAAGNFKDTADTAGVTALTKVALATVEHGNASSSISGIAGLEAARQVQVPAEVAGRVTRISFTSGQAVAAGQLLLQLNDAPEQAERIRLQAQLRNAQTALARTRSLVAQNAATQEQLDDARAAHDMALSGLRQNEALIAQKAIRAPFSGAVGIRRVHEGQYLNAGDAIVSLVDARTLHANFSLAEQSSPGLYVGQPVELLVDAYPGRSFQAKVSAIDPLIDRSRTVQVQATLTNPDSLLKAGMYASIQVALAETQPVLTIPETAVTYTAYGDTVFVAERNDQQMLVVKRVAVEAGERRDGRVEIDKGLREGDRVVTSGQLKLSDGMAVEEVTHDTLAAPDPLASDIAQVSP
ncbi:efflux RND transporter periplasmic adaptor subunit [Pseudomonas plecoglossicida]|uniref:efflux RND transporter periplasmic adaptor subunit n=1 Tax=Pseudomonas plecoglossicida TaxID=70775 RepID=UPI0015E42D77|nr:efflux RND transporter periplasmic adaptor subunit [Pseudomonas plecoglossicida]MBA1323679.1 efflux RND transporter periplasmic adaptor subunit [Pseudomonas plecoglossicida]